jgi:hypothetical protein
MMKLDILVIGSYDLILTKHESITYATFSIVIDVSAILVETITFPRI